VSVQFLNQFVLMLLAVLPGNILWAKIKVTILSSYRLWALYVHCRPMFFSNYGPKSGGGGKSLLFLFACWSNIFPNT